MQLSPSAPLAQVQAFLQAHQRDGVECPACHQFVKVYRRRINASMAKSLITMFRATVGVNYSLNGETSYVHLPTIVGSRSREEGKLAYWRLVEERRTVNDGGGRDGYWRLTESGRKFVMGALKVPQYAYVYNGECLGLDGEPVSIQEVLKSGGFEYRELMSA